jgi:hypothetical protein
MPRAETKPYTFVAQLLQALEYWHAHIMHNIADGPDKYTAADQHACLVL